MMAGHGHAGELPTATPHMRRVVVAVLVPLVLATIAGLVLLWPTGESPRLESGIRTDATILDIRPCGEFTAAEPADAEGEPVAGECREAEVSVAEGPDAGIQTLVPLPFGAGAPTFEVGDEIVLSGMPDFPLDSRYEVLDFQRTTPLLLLGAVFAVAVVALSGWKGV
ncbi:MAG TPA: hypothetical protein VFQ15_02165, partial [Jiangellaceae bacterium]|nr:hypothetical protein [Jiangellaceae bacterium]